MIERKNILDFVFFLKKDGLLAHFDKEKQIFFIKDQKIKADIDLNLPSQFSYLKACYQYKIKPSHYDFWFKNKNERQQEHEYFTRKNYKLYKSIGGDFMKEGFIFYAKKVGKSYFVINPQRGKEKINHYRNSFFLERFSPFELDFLIDSQEREENFDLEKALLEKRKEENFKKIKEKELDELEEKIRRVKQDINFYNSRLKEFEIDNLFSCN